MRSKRALTIFSIKVAGTISAGHACFVRVEAGICLSSGVKFARHVFTLLYLHQYDESRETSYRSISTGSAHSHKCFLEKDPNANGSHKKHVTNKAVTTYTTKIELCNFSSVSLVINV